MTWWELMQRFSLRDVEDDGAEGGEVPEEAAGDLQEGDPSQGGGAPVRSAVPEDALPEFLRGRSPDEVRQAISQAFDGAKEANTELRNLKGELDQIKQHLNQPKAEEPDPKDDKPLDELLYENPEEAIDRVVRKRYGHRFAGLEDQVGTTVLATLRNELPDFAEVEDDVDDLLKRSGAPRTRANIVGAYKMALGERAMAERAQASRKAAAPERPKPPKDEGKKKPKISSLESEIAERLGLTKEEYIDSRDNPMDIKVPT